MEAQSFLSGVCPKLSVPSIRHPALPSLSFCSFVQSQKLASRGTFKSITYKESSRKRIMSETISGFWAPASSTTSVLWKNICIFVFCSEIQLFCHIFIIIKGYNFHGSSKLFFWGLSKIISPINKKKIGLKFSIGQVIKEIKEWWGVWSREWWILS